MHTIHDSPLFLSLSFSIASATFIASFPAHNLLLTVRSTQHMQTDEMSHVFWGGDSLHTDVLEKGGTSQEREGCSGIMCTSPN